MGFNCKEWQTKACRLGTHTHTHTQNKLYLLLLLRHSLTPKLLMSSPNSGQRLVELPEGSMDNCRAYDSWNQFSVFPNLAVNPHRKPGSRDPSIIVTWEPHVTASCEAARLPTVRVNKPKSSGKKSPQLIFILTVSLKFSAFFWVCSQNRKWTIQVHTPCVTFACMVIFLCSGTLSHHLLVQCTVVGVGLFSQRLGPQSKLFNGKTDFNELFRFIQSIIGK